jgi:hypothetical protein
MLEKFGLFIVAREAAYGAARRRAALRERRNTRLVSWSSAGMQRPRAVDRSCRDAETSVSSVRREGRADNVSV